MKTYDECPRVYCDGCGEVIFARNQWSISGPYSIVRLYTGREGITCEYLSHEHFRYSPSLPLPVGYLIGCPCGERRKIALWPERRLLDYHYEND